MSVLLTRGTRLSQPQGPVEVDWANPLTRWLEFVTLPKARSINLGSGPKTPIILSGGGPLTSSPLKSGVPSRNVLDDYAIWDGSKFKTSSEYTVFALIRHDSNRGSYQNFIDADNGSSARIFQARLTTSNTVEFIPFNTGGSPFFVYSTSTISGTEDTFDACRVLGGTASVWVNGRLEGSTSVGSAATLGVANAKVALQVSATATGGAGIQGFRSALYVGGILSRGASDTEIKSLSSNPWQLFKPVQRRVWFDGGAAAGGASQTIAFTLDDITSSVSQTLSHSQSAAFTLDGIDTIINQTTVHSQSLSTSLADISVNISQTISPVKSQSVVFVLDDVSASITQVIGSGNFQNIGFTLDGISSSVSQTLVHSQTSSFSLEDVLVSVNQTARHGQALAISLEDVSIGIAQSVATSKQQTLSITLDGVSVAINQAAPSTPLTDAEMRDMYDKVLLIYANMLTVPKFLALK